MPDMRTLHPKSTAFVMHADGTVSYIYGLEDGSCLKVVMPLTMAALHLAGLAGAVSTEYARVAK